MKGTVALVCLSVTAAAFAADRKVGIIGCDTSHAIAFAKIANVDRDPSVAGFRVTAAYQWGSRDIVSSTNRYPEYLKKFAEMGVAMKPSIAALLAEVDCVLLETNDGRPHYEQALEVFRSGKPVFIDKPVAADLADAVKIVEAGRKLNAKWFCTSCLRFQGVIDGVKAGKYGRLRGAETYSPYKVEPTQSRYYWYAIHGAEPLFALMGTGCREVRCIAGAHEDVLVGTWADGRIGVQRALDVNTMDGTGYGGSVQTEKGCVALNGNMGYQPLLAAIMEFFRTGRTPVSPEETLEIYAFLAAAERSYAEGGRTVTLAEMLDAARQGKAK